MNISLNLGSGTSRYKDYLSVDHFVPGVDVDHDLCKPLPYPDNSVDNIYSSHVVEHFTRDEWEAVRQDWMRVIRPGGKIEIRCPNLQTVCELLLGAISTNDHVGQKLQLQRLYGSQVGEGQLHKNGFTQQSLVDSFPGFTWQLLQPSTEYELHMCFTKL